MVDVSIIETSGLGDRSYLVNDGTIAVAIDPQRDIDRVLELAGDLRITHVLETHIHNDYVTGGLALANATGAQYVVPAGAAQVADAQRELARIGVDRLTGSATGDIHALAAGDGLRSYRVAAFEDLVDALSDEEVVVLDVRQADEFDSGHVRGAVNVALHELPERIGELPEGRELWIHCASGYRASVAAALLDRHRRRVVLIDDDYANAEKLELT